MKLSSYEINITSHFFTNDCKELTCENLVFLFLMYLSKKYVF